MIWTNIQNMAASVGAPTVECTMSEIRLRINQNLPVWVEPLQGKSKPILATIPIKE
jgi:hypothetical protein